MIFDTRRAEPRLSEPKVLPNGVGIPEAKSRFLGTRQDRSAE
jgi:hypothetical protein